MEVAEHREQQAHRERLDQPERQDQVEHQARREQMAKLERQGRRDPLERLEAVEQQERVDRRERRERVEVAEHREQQAHRERLDRQELQGFRERLGVRAHQVGLDLPDLLDRLVPRVLQEHPVQSVDREVLASLEQLAQREQPEPLEIRETLPILHSETVRRQQVCHLRHCAGQARYLICTFALTLALSLNALEVLDRRIASRRSPFEWRFVPMQSRAGNSVAS